MTGTYRDEEIRDLEVDGQYLYYSAYKKEWVTISEKVVYQCICSAGDIKSETKPFNTLQAQQEQTVSKLFWPSD